MRELSAGHHEEQMAAFKLCYSSLSPAHGQDVTEDDHEVAPEAIVVTDGRSVAVLGDSSRARSIATWVSRFPPGQGRMVLDRLGGYSSDVAVQGAFAIPGSTAAAVSRLQAEFGLPVASNPPSGGPRRRDALVQRQLAQLAAS